MRMSSHRILRARSELRNLAPSELTRTKIISVTSSYDN